MELRVTDGVFFYDEKGRLLVVFVKKDNGYGVFTKGLSFWFNSVERPTIMDAMHFLEMSEHIRT